MTPTKEEFQLLYLSKPQEIKNLKPEDIFVFDIEVCNTNIDKNYECLDLNSLKKLSKEFCEFSTPDYSMKIYKTTVIEKDGVFYLVLSLYTIINKNNQKLIKDIQASEDLKVIYGLHSKNYKCSICESHIRNDCTYHKEGQIYNNKIAYKLITDARLGSWMLNY